MALSGWLTGVYYGDWGIWSPSKISQADIPNMTVTQDGKVGIDTRYPGEKLSVF
jgi:hypothetical protein